MILTIFIYFHRNQVALIGSPLFSAQSNYEFLLYANNLDQDGFINITIDDEDRRIFKSSDLDDFKKIEFEVIFKIFKHEAVKLINQA